MDTTRTVVARAFASVLMNTTGCIHIPHTCAMPSRWCRRCDDWVCWVHLQDKKR